MDLVLQNRVASLMHAELARRMLIKYFTEKGIENFTKPIHPMVMVNIAMELPELSNKIEVAPYVIDLDPMTGRSEIGWILFVLGMHSMYLGKTKHDNLNQIARASQGQPEYASATEMATTPERLIDYVRKKLAASENGKLDLGRQSITPMWMRRPTITSPTASYYEKRRWG